MTFRVSTKIAHGKRIKVNADSVEQSALLSLKTLIAEDWHLVVQWWAPFCAAAVRPRYDLSCVWWDVKPYSINQAAAVHGLSVNPQMW